jgi:hypothetical protein
MRHDYCPLLDYRNNKWPHWDECGLDEWKEFIAEFPEHVAVVLICGGEPTLISWMPDLANWLLDSGRKVVVFTNFAKPEVFKRVKPSSRLQIQATYHHDDRQSRYILACNLVKSYGHKVESTEINNDDKKLDFTRLKPEITPQTAPKERGFHAMPNAPRTRAIYCGWEWTYPELTIWRKGNVVHPFRH